MSEQVRTESQKVAEFFTKSINDNIGRIEHLYSEVEKIEAKGIERATQNVEEAARLAKESMTYARELAAAWRGMVLESMKRTTELFTAKVGG